ncbi:MAG TPA: efflux transporter outer membrane subunit [Rhizomicrobium sp.]|nr:efflux transporter outer membrane subunit [Rhizomicrobium sp.]
MRKLAFLPALLLTACTMGPDFVAPAPPAAGTYTKEPLAPASGDASIKGGTPQTYAMGRDIPAEWWSLFRSPDLDALVRASIAGNPNLTAAQASLRVAMENVKAQIGAYYPQVNAGLGASRQENSVILSPTLASNDLLFNLYQAQLGASWTLDLWGANKRQVEALRAAAEAQHYQLESAYVALTTNVVAAAVQEASLRDQIAATNQMLAAERQILTIEQHQKELGQIAGADLATQEVVVAQTEQTLPPLQKQLAQTRDLLTALAGRLPSDEIPQTFTLDALTLPVELPVSLPAKLVEQRPDIKIAEANLHAASAEVGVAIANMLPNITLSAADGTVGTELGHLFGPGAGFWSIGAGLTQPIFDGGQLLHKSRAARATLDQASAQYQATVIAALQNVADALHALQADGDGLRTAAAAQAAAQKSFDIARRQMDAGQIDRLALLQAQQAYLQTRLALSQAEAARFADTAALFQALGGGWWNRADEAPPPREESALDLPLP